MSNTSTRGASATSTKASTANEMKVVHTFAKNAFEEVRAYLQPYKGSQLSHRSGSSPRTRTTLTARRRRGSH